MHAIRLYRQCHIATIIHNEGRPYIMSGLPQLLCLMIELSPGRGLISILKQDGATSRGFLQRFDQREPSHDVRVHNYVEPVKDLPTRWN